MNRSAVVYGGAALLAVGLGAGVALMQPKAPSATVSLKAAAEPADPRGVRESLVEELIEASRGSAHPERLPAFDVVVSMIDGKHPEVLDRLLEPDVPEPFAIAVARAVSRRGEGPDRAARLLEPWLIRRSQAAVDAVLYRGEAEVLRDPTTGARMGRYRSIVMVWDAPVVWDPVEEEGVFLLQLERGGATILTMVLPEGVSRVLARPGAEAGITVPSID